MYLSLHYNVADSHLFDSGTEIIKLKKDSEIVANPICLGNISKDFSVSNMKKGILLLWGLKSGDYGNIFIILVLIIKLL